MRRALRLLRLVPLLMLPASTPVLGACGDSTGPDGCCRVCTSGKACGDSCISANETCNRGAGCACNG